MCLRGTVGSTNLIFFSGIHNGLPTISLTFFIVLDVTAECEGLDPPAGTLSNDDSFRIKASLRDRRRAWYQTFFEIKRSQPPSTTIQTKATTVSPANHVRSHVAKHSCVSPHPDNGRNVHVFLVTALTEEVRRPTEDARSSACKCRRILAASSRGDLAFTPLTLWTSTLCPHHCGRCAADERSLLSSLGKATTKCFRWSLRSQTTIPTTGGNSR